MRLLETDETDHIRLTKDFQENEIPGYAILSHTWGPDEEEVTFADLQASAGENKPGFEKIRFCALQAKRDGIKYFWIDSCCIDKSNNVELSRAINSMFRWYLRAERCYVYLPDVAKPEESSLDYDGQQTWEVDFSNSRWFTRGWTLQELLAPSSVEFFAKNGCKLGSKTSLERQVCAITKIPVKALRGSSFSGFPIQERFSWQEGRRTREEEDLIYSLLGIFDVSMSVIYGEGKDKARRRLMSKIESASKGHRNEDFSVTLNIPNVFKPEEFVARESELQEICSALTSDGTRRTITLHGLGGIGKTQLAMAYALRFKDKYSAVFWVNIKDEATVQSEFVRIAQQIAREHPSTSGLGIVNISEDVNRAVEAVKAWLGLPNNTRWLMICDNYDNPKVEGSTGPTAVDIHKYFPESYQGSVLITTRSSQVDIGRTLQVKKLEHVQDSLAILSNNSKRGDISSDPDAIALVTKLDGLPLALATAGAYLRQTSVTFAQYLRLYESSWARLQITSPSLSSYTDRTLYSTWQLSFEHIEKKSLISANMLRLWAHFDNQDVWFELLDHSDRISPEWFLDLTKDEISFHQAFRVLSDHGIVETNEFKDKMPESKGYSIHTCVHSWTKTVLTSGGHPDLAKLALTCVAAHVPSRESRQWWQVERRLLNHALIISRADPQGTDDGSNIGWAYSNLGMLFYDQGKYVEAEDRYQRALRCHQETLGAVHPSTLSSIHCLAVAYHYQSRYDEAETMYRQVLRDSQSTPKFNNLDTLQNLSNLYMQQFMFKEAEELLQRVLQDRLATLGEHHPKTLLSTGNLASIYQHQDKLEEAEKMFLRVLEGMAKALGEDDPSTLEAVHHLGYTYGRQARYDEAEAMYLRARSGKIRNYGEDHPDTLATSAQLGALYSDQKRYSEAEDVLMQVLSKRNKVLGPYHNLTLSTAICLGELYRRQRKFEEAEKLFADALVGCEKARRADTIHAFDACYGLGLVYEAQDRLGEAETMFKQALEGYERIFGKDHTDTLMIVVNLGLVCKEQRRLVEAQRMYERSMQGYEKMNPKQRAYLGDLGEALRSGNETRVEDVESVPPEQDASPSGNPREQGGDLRKRGLSWRKALPWRRK